MKEKIINFLYNLYSERTPLGVGIMCFSISILSFIIGLVIPIFFIPMIIFFMLLFVNCFFDKEISRWIWNLYYGV